MVCKCQEVGKQKARIIDMIKRNNNWELIDKIEKELLQDPLTLKGFIDIHFEKHHSTSVDDGIMNTDEIKKAFDHEVRKISLELGYNFSKIKSLYDYVDHYCDLYVEGEPLDIWVNQQSPLFNSEDITWAIWNLWCGKVVWK